MVEFSLSERQQVTGRTAREFVDARQVADGTSGPPLSVVVEGPL